MCSNCGNAVDGNYSFFGKSRRKAASKLTSKRHKKIERCTSLPRNEEVKDLKASSSDYGLEELVLEKQVFRIYRRNNSLPNISALCEAERNYLTSPSSRKSWYKRSSGLKRSQSMEWEPISALFTAATENDLTELERILTEFKIEINFLGPTGISLLHTAALVGSVKALQLLLNFGAEIDFLDANNRTGLEVALLAGNFDCAALLIENGACMHNIVDGMKVY